LAGHPLCTGRPQDAHSSTHRAHRQCLPCLQLWCLPANRTNLRGCDHRSVGALQQKGRKEPPEAEAGEGKGDVKNGRNFHNLPDQQKESVFPSLNSITFWNSRSGTSILISSVSPLGAKPPQGELFCSLGRFDPYPTSPVVRPAWTRRAAHLHHHRRSASSLTPQLLEPWLQNLRLSP
jgi:hypothetical protein